MPTGAIEVIVTELKILNPAITPPFLIEDDIDVSETIRLKHRHLDLRRPQMQRNIVLRHQATASVRRFLNDNGFLEIEFFVPEKSRETFTVTINAENENSKSSKILQIFSLGEPPDHGGGP